MSAENASRHDGSVGVISMFELYRLDELKRRMAWTDSSLRSARRRGLRVLGHGKRRYVKGRDVIRFLESVSGIY
jgi:hypothetical protein